jgi:hypothetical protein
MMQLLIPLLRRTRRSAVVTQDVGRALIWPVNDRRTAEQRAQDHQRAEYESAVARLLNQARPD